jgi:Ca2+/H+ antiporter, TMEM165/GDT1 family
MESSIYAFLVSTGIVTLAEIGDKTQLLAFMLATRFKKPLPIILGILVATLLNHGLAGALGTGIAVYLGPLWLKWILTISFIAMSLWILVPDKMDDDESNSLAKGWGVFGTTCLTFFLAEMGDKTQLATVALAAQYANYLWVVAGTTLGMMIADVPAVFVGNKFSDKIPLPLVRIVAALLFGAMGILAYFKF